MDEDTNAPAPSEATENSTTPAEVAEVLHLNTPETTAEEPAETPETPAAPVEEEPATPTEPAAETPAETPAPASVPPQPAAEVPTFTMEVEDANGNKFTVSELADLPEDFEPKNNRQIMEILDGIRDLKGQKEAYTSSEEQKAAKAERDEAVSTIQAGWDAEIKELQGSKRLPTAVDPKNPEDKANQHIQAIYKFMAEENDKRQQAGRPLLASIEDALDKMELRESKEAKVEADKQERELARQRGGMVGGSSAPASSGAPVYRSGSARNANEALRIMGLTHA